MSEVVKIVMDKNDLQPLADEVKKLRGGNESITLAQMEDELLSVNDEVDVQAELLVQIAAALEGKAAGSGGTNTSDATAVATEIFEGKTAYVSGGKVTGTFTIASELSTQNDLIAQIRNTANNLPNAGGSAAPVLQSKTVTPSTSSQTIVADSGYDGLNQVTVNAMPVVAQAVPGISVNSNGLITATATQAEGYVVAGTKSSTSQLAFQSAKTITPSSMSQIAVSSGYYTGGDIVVSGDSNLIAENIKSGVSIFGVNGTHAGSSGGDSGISEMFDQMIEGTLINCINNTANQIGNYAFGSLTTLKSVNFTACSQIGQQAFEGCTSLATAIFPTCISMASSAFAKCTKLTSISFPECKNIYWAGFSSCSALTTVDLPACTYLGGRAFQYCTKLASISLPLCKQIYSSTFQSCSALTTISLPSATMIGSTAFGNCTKLSTFYLTGSSVCALSGSNAFTGTGITSTAGSIYVNASLVDEYKATTNWAYFSNRIFAIE